ncbi:MAG TPA: polyprenyl synthetase family protein [Candidatus Limnocylindrales bacterium]|nr:polyprenyl synthetase family protein [Candidatus Limnocylindrales bacterium]
MDSNNELVNAVTQTFQRKGIAALEKARSDLISEFSDDNPVSEAIRYFSRVTLEGVLPVFPALIAISCEAVGGKAENTVPIGSAMVCITGAADIHDDIIDNSTLKRFKRTVFGRFGKSIALLAGDSLLTKGLVLAGQECVRVSPTNHGIITNLLANGVFKISCAQALESQMLGNLELLPDQLFQIIRLKSVVTELNMRIGAIIGNGKPAQIETLANVGRTFGIVSIVIDEMNDLLNLQELRNRLTNECPPLPFLYAIQDDSVRTEIISLARTKPLTNKNLELISKKVLCSKKIDALREQMRTLVNSEISGNQSAETEKWWQTSKTLLSASIEYLNSIGIS